MFPDSLKEGAILIADAHCAPWRTSFIDFLRALESGEIRTPQLILMGDIFDMLFAPIPKFHHDNREGIELLNLLSENIEIFYLEGNHDFLVTEIFPNIFVVPRQQQPIILRYGEERIAFSHGDQMMGMGYEIYTRLIRNPIILRLLGVIDRWGGNFIVKWLERRMRQKSHCHKIDNFEALIDKRMKLIHSAEYNLLIEGHFHQNCTFDFPKTGYINLGAFACNERYFTVQSTLDKPLLNEAVFRKEPL
jgi:UDP-2,3-diacylglucosamine hydrolase